MLEFPIDYFQAEEREGFLVDATMKTVWAAELEVLNEIAVICARHELQWYAAYGTLLGAVRHQGFIPWDDDIDIWMRREDYRRILEYLPKELPAGYVVRAPHARKGYPEYQVYVNNSDSISIEPEHLQKFHGCPFYVGIDIFPLDDIPSDQEKADIQRSLFASALMLQQIDHSTEIGENSENTEAERVAAITQISNLLDLMNDQYGINISKYLLQKKYRDELWIKLWHAAEQMPYMGKNTGSHQVAMYVDYLKFGKKYETIWFEEIDYLPFEGFDIPVPGNYDAVLRNIYGDYKVCVRSAGMHDYPCYKRQLEELRRKVEAAESKK